MELKQTASGKIKPVYENSHDRIAGYLTGLLEDKDLSLTEHEMMHRWIAIWTLLGNYHSPMQAVNTHVKQQKIKGKEISTRTAWNDYQNACKMWGNMAKTTVDSKLVLAEEYIMKTFQLAASSRDVKGMNSALSNLLDVIRMRKLDPNAPDFSQMKPAVINLVLNARDATKTINLSDLDKLNKTDFEEVIEFIEDNEVTTHDIEALLIEENNTDGDQL